MTDRRTITVREPVYERLSADKADDESWSDYLSRLADGDGEHGLNTVAVENVDEIGRATATQVENRMTRR